MAMTPEERTRFEKLEMTVQSLLRVENVPFIENIKRRLDVEGEVSSAVSQTTLTNLADVDTTGVTNGQVIKYNSTSEVWEPADDIDT